MVTVVVSCQAQRMTTYVKRVLDGDTFICFQNGANRSCRIANIDAPELKQHFGINAYQNLCNLIYGKKILIDSVGTDRYERIIVFVRLGNRRLDSLLISTGYAWYYQEYSNDLMKLAAAMTRALNKGLGLWHCGKTNVCPPWLFRHYNYVNRLKYCKGC